MTLNLANLKTIPAGQSFCVFIGGQAYAIYLMLASQRYVQLVGGMNSYTLESFEVMYKDYQATIYLTQSIIEP